MADLKWFVAHTKPRREKKLVEWCNREKLHTVLPCYESPHKYRGKTVVFQKPLFPGYVFLHVPPHRKDSLRQNDNVANLLEVFDEQTFEHQLQQILLALESNTGVRLAPNIDAGMRVRIKSGPMRGIEGWVQERQGLTTVLLRLDFISQAAAIKLDANLLELI